MTKKEKQYLEQELDRLLSMESIQAMDEFIQHGNVSCLIHCKSVAVLSYIFACKLKLKVDRAALIRGALLHDYFLYDWHDKNKGFRWHGFKHPNFALNNAKKNFELSFIECEIIKKHMWPMTIIPPKCKEAYIICLIDKYCSAREVMSGIKYKLLRAGT